MNGPCFSRCSSNNAGRGHEERGNAPHDGPAQLGNFVRVLCVCVCLYLVRPVPVEEAVEVDKQRFHVRQLLVSVGRRAVGWREGEKEHKPENGEKRTRGGGGVGGLTFGRGDGVERNPRCPSRRHGMHHPTRWSNQNRTSPGL